MCGKEETEGIRWHKGLKSAPKCQGESRRSKKEGGNTQKDVNLSLPRAGGRNGGWRKEDRQGKTSRAKGKRGVRVFGMVGKSPLKLGHKEGGNQPERLVQRWRKAGGS